MFNTEFLLNLGIRNILNYNRKSRKDEEEEKRTGEDTLKTMRDLMRRILDPLGIPYEQRDEVGSGDKIATRPVFQGVLQDLEDGKYECVAVKEIARLGRGSYTDMGVIYDLILKKRIFIMTTWRIYDPKNDDDRRQIRFELFMSREEFETTRQRLAGGRFNKALNGCWMAGKPPLGYSLDSKTRRLIPDSEKAFVVRYIFDLWVNGIPVEGSATKVDVRSRALATYLKKQGIKTVNGKEHWKTDILEKMLSNPVYIGTIIYRRTETLPDGSVIDRPVEEHVVVPNAHEGIIDMDTWEKAQTKNNSTDYVPRTKVDVTIYELTGLCVCKSCGAKMIRNAQVQKYVTRTGDNEERYYPREFLVCPNGCWRLKYQPIVEQLVETLHYLRNLSQEEVDSVLIPMLAEKPKPKLNQIQDVEQYVARRSAELKTRMKFIREKYELGVYDDNEFEESRSEIKEEQEKLQKILLSQREEEAEKQTVSVDQVRQHFDSALSAYDLAVDTKDKNQVLRSAFEKVYVERTEKGRGTKPSKFIVYPVVRHDFIFPDTLVL